MAGRPGQTLMEAPGARRQAPVAVSGDRPWSVQLEGAASKLGQGSLIA